MPCLVAYVVLGVMPVATVKNGANRLDLRSAGSNAMKSGTAPSKRRCNTNNVNEEVLDFYFGEFLRCRGTVTFYCFQPIRRQAFGVLFETGATEC